MASGGARPNCGRKKKTSDAAIVTIFRPGEPKGGTPYKTIELPRAIADALVACSDPVAAITRALRRRQRCTGTSDGGRCKTYTYMQTDGKHLCTRCAKGN